MRDEKNCESLLIELSTIESRGIILFLEGIKSSPACVAKAVEVQEDSSYMRDYIFEKGVLTELHFDKVENK